MNNDSRFPYTYACDYIRSFSDYNEGSIKLSRSEASQIRQGIAKAIGMDDEELAIKLAEYYKINKSEIDQKTFDKAVNILYNRG